MGDALSGADAASAMDSQAAAMERQARALEALIPELGREMLRISPDHLTTELPVMQLRVCNVLSGGSHSLSCIAERLGVSPSSTTQIADRLERAGLVERVPEEEDRRVRNLRLTACGEDLMRARREALVDRLRAVLARLSPEMRETVLMALTALVEASREASRADVAGAATITPEGGGCARSLVGGEPAADDVHPVADQHPADDVHPVIKARA